MQTLVQKKKKKSRVAVLTSDKVDFRAKTFTTNKDEKINPKEDNDS